MKSKFSFILVLSFFLTQTLLGQESEPALARAYYKFKHINDTTDRDNYHDEETVLYLGQHSSYYTTNSGKRVQEEVSKQMNSPAFNGNIVIESSGAGSSDSYYSVPNKQLFQMVYAIGGGERYLIESDFPALDWKVEEDSKEIGGYACQKATVHFKGRDYTAWFTTEIPFQAGPWKLQGLPGLILEASDSKEEVVFQYAGFDKMIEQDLLVELPKGVMKASMVDLERKIKAFNSNPQAYMQARMQGGGGVASGSFLRGRGVSDSPLSGLDQSKINSVEVRKVGMQKSKNTNNPIEIEN